MGDGPTWEIRQKNIKLADVVDEAIEAVCREVKEGDDGSGEYVGKVKVLAELVEARTHLR